MGLMTLDRTGPDRTGPDRTSGKRGRPRSVSRPFFEYCRNKQLPEAEGKKKKLKKTPYLQSYSMDELLNNEFAAGFGIERATVVSKYLEKCLSVRYSPLLACAVLTLYTVWSRSDCVFSSHWVRPIS